MAHSNKIAKSLLFLKDDPRVRDFFMEDDGYEPEKGDWSYWIYFRGLNYDTVHAIHEPTAKDVLERLSMMDECSADCDCWNW